ncbi:MAG: class II aldolase/adducin family protein [Pigmentiphaga sp.]|uniref:class II aldolase/adducin family protein n=1 Tax=Pigmentiphaga sp. TaxID=1977564 RepID=UPI0029B6014B|nr:class II aldolase/adducin family protein [Pigmentiphaga sp.]MDX3906427.1 class II aldolase/adducin family protein [Pigmentiphaga sp.]
MAIPQALLEELVTANHILASEGVVDAFGHISVRSPDDPGRYFLSRARPPERVEPGDIMEFTLEGEPIDARGRKPYLERFIHGAIYQARPDVQSVVHNHSRSVVPFAVTGAPLRPIVHSCATIGFNIPTWDAQDKFGDTTLLVSDMEMGRDLATVLAENRSTLMRGHGCTVVGGSIKEAVYTAIYLEVNANLQLQASRLGPITFLTEGEVEKICARLRDGLPGEGYARAWEYWRGRAYADRA